MNDLVSLIRRILNEPGTTFTAEPSNTGQLRGRIQTGWFELTDREADLLEGLLYGQDDGR